MRDIALKVEGLTKEYRLGTIGYGTMREDLQSWWARLRGKTDPNSLISANHHRDSDHNHFLALDDVSFEIKKGDRIGIIGRNGAGKSTLLKILSRITSPSKGNIYIDGKIGSLLEVGTGFHQELTGRENIYLNGSILGMKKREIEKKLDEIVDFAGIEKFIDTPVKRYSSGMFVRLGFAVAAHLEPEILIVDEVLAVGDAEFQKKAIGKMEEVSQNDGRTILFVSHNMLSVRNLCNKGIILQDGKVKNIGIIDPIVNEYLDLNLLTTNDYASRVIKKIWIENSNSNEVDKILMGIGFSLNFSFEIDIPFDDLSYGFGVEDMTGQRVFSLNNLISGDHVLSISKGTARCTIPECVLLPGEYYLSVSIVDLNKSYVDFFERGLKFKVEENDVFGTGLLIDQTQGKIFQRGVINVIES